MPRTHRYARHGQQYFVKVVMGTGRILCPPQCPGPRPSCQSSRSADALRHKQHAKATHSKHTGQYSLGLPANSPRQTHKTIFTWVTDSWQRIPTQCPWAPTSDIIVKGLFHRMTFITNSQKEKCHETCRSRHSANLRANYVAARSQMYSCEVACIVVSSVGAFHVSSSHLLGKIA